MKRVNETPVFFLIYTMKSVTETRKLAERRSWQHIFKQTYTVETNEDIQILEDCAKRTIATMTKQPFDSIVAETKNDCLTFKTTTVDISHLRVGYMHLFAEQNRTCSASPSHRSAMLRPAPTPKITETVKQEPIKREPKTAPPRTVTTQFDRPDYPMKYTRPAEAGRRLATQVSPEKHILEPIVWWCDNANDISELTRAFAIEMRKQGIHTAHPNSGDITTHTGKDGITNICCRNFSIGYRTAV